MAESVETSSEMTQPVILDLGRQKSKELRALKKGEGKLWDEVLGIVEEVKEQLGEKADGRVLMPVVMIYQKKPKRRRLENILFPYMRR